MKCIFFVLGTVWAAVAYGQSPGFTNDTLPLSIVADEVVAVEFTQDEWVDYLVYGTDSLGERGFWLYQNQGNYSFELIPTSINPLTQATWALADFNRDNQLDIVVSGRDESGTGVTEVYYYEGGSFSSHIQVNRQHAHTLTCADFDQDGRIDIFMSGLDEEGAARASCYRNTDEGFLRQGVDIAPTVSGKALAYDWNKDGYVDILQAGTLADGQPATYLYQNQGKFLFEPVPSGLLPLTATAVAMGDVNRDGQADVLLSGTDALNRPTALLYEYTELQYEAVEIDLAPAAGTFATLADYNHDGLTDVGLVGEDTLGQSVARWYFQSESGWTVATYDSLAGADARWATGDIDNDGHLDLLRTRTSDQPAGLLINSSPGNNQAPLASVNPSVSAIDTVTLFTWSPIADDRTDPLSFTYELYVVPEGADQYAVSPEYHDTTKMRVDHGRIGFRTAYTLHGLPEGTYNWNVNAVDNSFQLGRPCEGIDGPGTPLCFTIDREDTTVCAGTTLQLSAPENVAWTGTASGYLGQGQQLTYRARQAEVIYYTTRLGPGCAIAYSLRVTVPATDSLLASDTTVCVGELLSLAVDTAYSSATWFSAALGEVGRGHQLTIDIVGADTLWVEVPTEGCLLRDTVLVNVFPPVTLLATDTLRTPAGTSVVLEAQGADTYRWSPATGLSRPDVASPEASPSETTTYVVEGTTANGCIVTDTVTVIVTPPPVVTTLFVPNLFSPNGDGQNDTFRLYGQSIASITWQVYDRQGSRLFEANRLDIGWDGTYRGRPLPNGVYLWKVSGYHADGQPLQFEGEQSGMLRLVR